MYTHSEIPFELENNPIVSWTKTAVYSKVNEMITVDKTSYSSFTNGYLIN